jgi:hypothetical protein
MKDQFITFEGASFNKSWIQRRGTFEKFMEEANKNQHWFEGDPKRADKLKELFALATKQEQPESQTAVKPA